MYLYKFKERPKYTELLKNLDMDDNLLVSKEERGESGDVNKIDQKREAERKKASWHVKCSCAMTLIIQCQHQKYVISALLFSLRLLFLLNGVGYLIAALMITI